MYDKRVKVRVIQHAINSTIKNSKNYVTIVNSYRKCVYESKLWKECRKNEREYTFYLIYPDLLLYGFEKDKTNIELHQQLPIDHLFKYKNIKHHKKYGNTAFEIHTTLKSFIVYNKHIFLIIYFNFRFFFLKNKKK